MCEVQCLQVRSQTPRPISTRGKPDGCSGRRYANRGKYTQLEQALLPYTANCTAIVLYTRSSVVTVFGCGTRCSMGGTTNEEEQINITLYEATHIQ